MNTILTIVCTNFTHLFNDEPRAAMLLRTCNKNVRAEFDKFVSPITWWLWTQNFFIPSITGLPSDLKAEFYIKIIREYYAQGYVRDWDDMRCNFIYKIGSILHSRESMEEKVFQILRDFQSFTKSAKGRLFLLRMIGDWLKTTRYIAEGRESKDVEILEAVEKFVLYSVHLYSYMQFGAGYGRVYDQTIERMFLEQLYDKWRV
jgi:hypothetical protein